MSLDTIHKKPSVHIQQILFPLLKTIEDQYMISINSMKVKNTSSTCRFIDTQPCKYKTFKDNLCEYHYNLIQEKTIVDNKPKTGNKNITAQDLLNSIIFQKLHTLEKHEYGYINPETDLLFNDEFEVIGKWSSNKNSIEKLNRFDCDQCDRFGFIYTLDIIQEGEADTFDKRNIVLQIDEDDED